MPFKQLTPLKTDIRLSERIKAAHTSHLLLREQVRLHGLLEDLVSDTTGRRGDKGVMKRLHVDCDPWLPRLPVCR